MHRAGDVDVEVAVEARVDAALQADLGGAELRTPRGTRSAISSRVSRYGVPRRLSDSGPLEKPQKRALEGAHVGVVDVAVDHVGDVVADGAARSSSASSATAATSGPRAANSVVSASSSRRSPPAAASSTSRDRAAAPRRVPGSSTCGVVSAPEYQRGRAAADLHDLGAGADVGGRRGAARARSRPGSSRPRPSASERSSTGKRSRVVEPALGSQRRTPGRWSAAAPARSPRASVAVTQHVQRRPGALGVDVVGGDR